MRDINEAPEFSQVKGRLIAGGDFFSGENGELTLLELQEKHPTWYHGDIIYGLERLQRIAESGRIYVYSVYSAGESDQSHRLDEVRLLFLPARQQTRKTCALLLAGGAYGAVCTLVESLPVAARLNELGISCFCLNYRTAIQESFVKGLLPEPLDDLAAAWRFIQRHQELFSVDARDYLVGGFSAGGHLASLWGTSHLGARAYDIPQPQMLLLAYPLITMEHMPEGPLKSMMCTGMFGAEFTLEKIRKYDASRHVDGEYPRVYLARSLDDSTVSSQNGNALVSALDAAGIPHIVEEALMGGHGFGLGTVTPLNGWVERASAFLDA